MKTSSRTKTCKRKMIFYKALSIAIWIGIAIFSIVSIFVKIKKGGPGSTENNYVAIEFKSGLIGLGITISVALIIALFMSNKMRTMVYMISIMIAAIVYGNAAMIIEACIWAVDEYIIKELGDSYKLKYMTNKEIDLR